MAENVGKSDAFIPDNGRFIRGESLSRESDILIAAIDDATLHDDTQEVFSEHQKESVENLCSIVSDMPVESDVPPYISDAARLISDALRFEEDERYEESLAAYRSAIGQLLSCVQSDPDLSRQGQVKRRIAQYISKAELLVKREAESRLRKTSKKRSMGIPHLQLFGQLDELKQFKVKGVLVDKIILAENLDSGELVIFKTLHKSPAVYKKSKTSLLPINIAYMVRLLKYFETDDCVYLMLEYCSSGRLWDIVKPLVFQGNSAYDQANSAVESSAESLDESDIEQFEKPFNTSIKRQTSIIKASQSFIRDRKISINATAETRDVPDVSDNDSSDSLDDISVVHTNLDSMVIVTNDQIERFDGYDEPEVDTPVSSPQSTLMKNSKKMLDSISKTLSRQDSGAKNVLEKLDTIETRIRQHMKGKISPDEETSPTPPSRLTLRDQETPVVFDSPSQPKESEEKLPSADFEIKSSPLTVRRPPRILRKLSELLPQCPDPYMLDSTMLPDRLVRTWAAEIAQVLFSLHYREILVRDLNPANVLLDSCGHVKLTYQCEWVSVDSVLDREAVAENFCAPEVVSVGDLTPAADWWSYGALLHLLYCGQSPSSVIASGMDSSIPLGGLPPGLGLEVRQFICELLQPAPEMRLGAGSMGSNDIRVHSFFKGWDWDKMCWT